MFWLIRKRFAGSAAFLIAAVASAPQRGQVLVVAVGAERVFELAEPSHPTRGATSGQMSRPPSPRRTGRWSAEWSNQPHNRDGATN